MRRRRWPRLAIAIAIAAAGCGDDGGGEPFALDGSDTEIGGTAADTGGLAEGGATSTEADTTVGDDVTDGSDDTTAGPIDPIDGPQVYPAGRVHSPVSAHVAQVWRDIAAAGPEQADDVFMKVGASSTVSPSTLYCFADDAQVDLGVYGSLASTRQWFLGGDADGTTPFDRDTLAAEVGRTAGWAIEGMPSPLDMELSALSPQLALVHYGTNDMGFGATYDAALASFYENMSTLCDTLQDQGVVPILFSITRRGDNPAAQRWVATYNAAIRGLAQQRQVPFVDLFEAIDGLGGNGLSDDGLHLDASPEGACMLDDAGLEYGYNVRNLVALQALDRAVAVLVDEADGLEDPVPPREGTGTFDDPITIDALPFADGRDTTVDGAAVIGQYPGCSDSDQSGPEIWYRLSLDAPRSLRWVILDREGVDLDVHVLADGADPDVDCLARDDRLIEATLPAGEYWVVVDTWGGAGVPLAGPFVLVVTECDPGDPDCA